MMFAHVLELAPIETNEGVCWDELAALSPIMNYLSGGHPIKMPTSPAEAVAKIDIFRIEEEIFIQESYLIQGSSAQDQAGALDQIHSVRLLMIPIFHVIAAAWYKRSEMEHA